MKLRDVVFSIDFAFAAFAFAAAAFLLPSQIPNSFAKDAYSMGISVLSIVFSVFFAALAIIVTSGDDEFINFLQMNNLYLKIIAFFKFTVSALFCALVYSIVLYGYTARMSEPTATQSKFLIATFAAAFFYAIFAAFGSTNDAIKYAERRVAFLGTRPPTL